jgi:hypothetical protein
MVYHLSLTSAPSRLHRGALTVEQAQVVVMRQWEPPAESGRYYPASATMHAPPPSLALTPPCLTLASQTTPTHTWAYRWRCRLSMRMAARIEMEMERKMVKVGWMVLEEMEMESTGYSSTALRGVKPAAIHMRKGHRCRGVDVPSLLPARSRLALAFAFALAPALVPALEERPLGIVQDVQTLSCGSTRTHSQRWRNAGVGAGAGARASTSPSSLSSALPSHPTSARPFMASRRSMGR